MADTKIDQRQAESWAQEKTLEKLVRAVGNSNTILQDISAGKASKLDLSALQQGVNRAGSAVRTSAEDVGRATSDLKKSMNSVGSTVSYEMKQYGRNISSASDLASQFGRNLKDMGDFLGRGLGKVLPGAGIAVGAFGAAVGYTVTQLQKSRDAFSEMTQSGLLFGGNVLDFASDVARAGLDIREFSYTAGRFSEALVVTGERNFLRSITSLRESFARFNIQPREGAEYFAEFLDQMRLSGSAFFMTQSQMEDAFKVTIQQQQTIANLTGRSIKQQQAEARRLQESKKYQALEAGMTPEMKQRLTALQTQYATVFGAEGFEQIVNLARLGAVQSTDFTTMMTTQFGGLLEQLGAAVNTALETGQFGQVEAIKQRMFEQLKGMEGTDAYRQASVMLLGSGRAPGGAGELLEFRRRNIAAAMYGTREEVPPRTPGQPTVDETTRQINLAASLFQQKVGEMNAEATKAASQGLKSMTEGVELLNTKMKELDFVKLGNDMKRELGFLEGLGEAVSKVVSKASEATGVPGEVIAGLGAVGLWAGAKKAIGGAFSLGGKAMSAIPALAGPGGGAMSGAGGLLSRVLKIGGGLAGAKSVYDVSQGQYGDALESALAAGTTFAPGWWKALPAALLTGTSLYRRGWIDTFGSMQAPDVDARRLRIGEMASQMSVRPMTAPVLEPGQRASDEQLARLQAYITKLEEEYNANLARQRAGENVGELLNRLYKAITDQTDILEKAIGQTQ